MCVHNGQLLSAFMASNCQVPRVCKPCSASSRSKVNVVVAAAAAAAVHLVAVEVGNIVSRMGKINFKLKMSHCCLLASTHHVTFRAGSSKP